MDQVSEIREKIDIVALIAEAVTLKKSGQNFKGLCPFHGEKTPSFMVSPQRQMWHCFGCGKGGDAYSFLMEFEHIEFPEALRILAQKAGVSLARSAFETQITSKKERFYKINKFACEYYHYILTSHKAGKKAREYLETRGVTSPLYDTFKLGFAPQLGNGLVQYLMKKKQIEVDDLFDVGLASRRGRDVVDFFSGRIIFPLIDHRDNIIGFSGRIMDETSSGPKYMNTRDTVIYHKGESFFGFNTAKEEIKKKQQVHLVEGEFDVISCFKEGVTNTLAIKGTALTEYQANLLARFATKITICFDGDSAGQEAIKRSLAVLEKKQLLTTVVEIPNGKDPDEAIKNDPYAFKKALKQDTNVYDYLLTQTLKKHDTTTVEGRRAVAEELLPLLTRIENEIVKEFYLKKLSVSLDTTYESIVKELSRHKQQVDRAKKEAVVKIKKPREEVMEEYLLALILQSPSPKETLEAVVTVLEKSIGKERAYQKVLHHLLTYFTEYHAFDSAQFGKLLPTELLEVYNTSFLFPLTPFGEQEYYIKEGKKVAGELRGLYLRKQLKELSQQIQEKDQSGDNSEALKQEYSTLIQLLEKK